MVGLIMGGEGDSAPPPARTVAKVDEACAKACLDPFSTKFAEIESCIREKGLDADCGLAAGPEEAGEYCGGKCLRGVTAETACRQKKTPMMAACQPRCDLLGADADYDGCLDACSRAKFGEQIPRCSTL